MARPNQAAAVAGHEVDLFRRRKVAGMMRSPFIFAILSGRTRNITSAIAGIFDNSSIDEIAAGSHADMLESFRRISAIMRATLARQHIDLKGSHVRRVPVWTVLW